MIMNYLEFFLWGLDLPAFLMLGAAIGCFGLLMWLARQ
jgi:hypothetical protein